MNILDTPQTDPLWHGTVLAHEDGYRWIAVPMLYNHRLICVPDDSLGSASYGWCYADAITLRLAATLFDPDTQDEPLGWHKRAGADIRRAPHRDQDPDHNRPRCVHGSYLHTSTCHVQYCPETVAHADRPGYLEKWHEQSAREAQDG